MLRLLSIIHCLQNRAFRHPHRVDNTAIGHPITSPLSGVTSSHRALFVLPDPPSACDPTSYTSGVTSKLNLRRARPGSTASAYPSSTRRHTPDAPPTAAVASYRDIWRHFSTARLLCTAVSSHATRLWSLPGGPAL